jgi:hypothetical protein
MSPEQQRIAIAEACGWTNVHPSNPPCGYTERYAGTPSATIVCVPIPDYLNDLNAMHEAETYGCFDLNNKSYAKNLAEVVLRDPQGMHHITANWWAIKRIATATAAQRAEAFLKTLNLWKP